jgi:hypothetical protein
VDQQRVKKKQLLVLADAGGFRYPEQPHDDRSDNVHLVQATVGCCESEWATRTDGFAGFKRGHSWTVGVRMGEAKKPGPSSENEESSGLEEEGLLSNSESGSLIHGRERRVRGVISPMTAKARLIH